MLFKARRSRSDVTRAPALDFRERELAARVRAGEEAAFEELFTAYYRSLCDVVWSYVHAPDVAEEIVQTVFLRIWAQRGEWDPAAGVRAFLFASCRNAALDHLKHEKIVASTAERAVREEATPALGQRAIDPGDHVQAEELAAALRREVAALPERRRMVVALRWEQHMSYAEIAAVLGVSEKTAETYFARAIATLRKQLAAFRS